MEQARRVAPSQQAGERNLSEVPEAHIAQIHASTLVRLVAILCTLLVHGQKKVEYIQTGTGTGTGSKTCNDWLPLIVPPRRTGLRVARRDALEL